MALYTRYGSLEKEDDDIDIIQTISELKNLLKDVKHIKTGDLKSTYIKQITRIAKEFCKQKKVPFKNLCEDSMLVISSESSYFETAIEADLIWRPEYSLELYLNFQLNNYKGKKLNDKRTFVNLISRNVCKRMEKRSPFNVNDRLKIIAKWALDKKNELGEPPSLKMLDFTKDVKLDLFNDIKDYFIEKQRKRLLKLLNGEPIRGKIVFIGLASSLIDVFYRLHNEDCIASSKTNTANWIAQHFRYKTDAIHDFDRDNVYNGMKTKYSNRRPNNSSKIEISFLKPIDSIKR
ncbi:MAG TPA: hypothetical protein PLK75_00410 [Bacteroidales bacterium]|nr:hypothetical protein [Bacteroidales bacterium]